jgi:putative transposase
MSDQRKIYLFIHVIWSVYQQQKLLNKPVRKVLFANIQKRAEEKGTKILVINGVEDHVHCLLQLLPAQNLLQVVKSIKTESSQWLNENKLLSVGFEWEDEYAAYSVSPSVINQVMDYINKQEEHHKTKTLEKEMEVFEKLHLPG